MGIDKSNGNGLTQEEFFNKFSREFDLLQKYIKYNIYISKLNITIILKVKIFGKFWKNFGKRGDI